MADSKKINPIEKAGISGVASGATIEGLSALMGADSIEKKYFTRYGFSEGGKEWGEISFEWMPTVNEWMPYNEDDPLSKDDLELFRKEKEYELVNEMLNDEKSRLHTFYINNPYHVDEEEFNTKYEVLNEDGEIENLGLLISWDEPEIEYRKSQYSTDPETPLYRFEFLDAEEQSAYWFLKGEMQSRAPLNEMDLEQIMEMLQNVPAKEMNEAIEQAEMMGDEAAMIVLVMADNKRKFREEYASEDEGLSQEQLSAYFARLKDKNPDLAKKIEYSIKDESYLPTVEINKAGFDDEIIEAWVDLVAVEDDKYAPFERCPECEGEGYILTSYTSATRFDPADGDGEDCGECGGNGLIDPADYMYYDDKGEIEYAAETKKRKTGFRKCSKCGYSDHNSTNCNRLNEYEEYLKHKNEMLRQCDRAIDDFTSSAKRYSEEGEYGMAKMLRSDATDMKKLKRMIEKNHFGKATHFAMGMDSQPRDMAPSALWLFDAETFNTEYDEEDMVHCNHCSDIVGNEKEVYGDETVDYEMANGELVCIPCHKIWMKEYKNDLDPHYTPFYAETFESENEKEVAIAVEKTRRGDTLYGIKYLDLGYEHTEWFMSKTDRDLHLDMYVEGFSAETESILKSPYLWGAGIFALTLGILSRKL